MQNYVYLYKDSPINYSNSCSYKHMRVRNHFNINKQDQSKGHGASQTTIHHNELVHSAQLVQTVTVGDTAKDYHADTSKKWMVEL